MGWIETSPQSWDQLQSKLTGASQLARAFSRPYIYRGEGKDFKSLKPALIRSSKKHHDRPFLLNIENRLGQEFKANAHLHLNQYVSKLLDNPIDSWTIMQHFGAPTRLLDWTVSPYVAAYFACASHPGDEGVIWAVHVESLNSTFKASITNSMLNDDNISPEFYKTWDPPRVCATRFSVRTDRMAVQQGVFTVCNDIMADHAEVIDGMMKPNLEPARHFKFVIDSGLKMEILKQLREMNISKASLFPGLDGFAGSLQEAACLAFEFGA